MRKSNKQGFSLVEVVLALGVVAFAFVAILGLIPAGMNSFRQAINISVCSQIGQKVIGDAFQADYDTLLTPLGASVDSTTEFLANYRYFDEEGNEILPNPLPTQASNNVAPRNSSGMLVPFVYLVVTKISPSIILPGIPPTSSTQTASITVQVVFDPSQNLPSTGDFSVASTASPQSGLLLLPTSTTYPAGNVLTFYAHITRN